MNNKTLIMGIVNVTPDSFSDGGRFLEVQKAIDHALQLEDEGADILDIGGESTRPGSDTVPAEEELRRIIPVLEGLAGRVSARLSIDTRKSKVMQEAIAAGASIVNDVSALTFDPESAGVVARSNVSVVLMHAQGDPKTMQQAPQYENVVAEVLQFLEERTAFCRQAGISDEKLIVDPGIGFGKTPDHNIELIRNLDQFGRLNIPILFGASRKSMISKISGEKDPMKRLPGSLMLAVLAAQKGAGIVRVHDVAETIQALKVWRACSRDML